MLSSILEVFIQSGLEIAFNLLFEPKVFIWKKVIDRPHRPQELVARFGKETRNALSNSLLPIVGRVFGATNASGRQMWLAVIEQAPQTPTMHESTKEAQRHVERVVWKYLKDEKRRLKEDNKKVKIA